MKTLFLMMLLAFSAFATEPRVSLKEAKSLGFKPFKFSAEKSLNQSVPAPHTLTWPFERPYRKGFQGNNFVQYQPYSPAGYHMGSDMVLERDSWVVAPLSGRLEAGSYTYTDLPDGTNIKQWLPWPQGGGPYFEVAIVADNGFRYEFHHVDKDSLPVNLVNMLNNGGGRIEKGERLGQVYRWTTMFHYDHVHVNVYNPQGKQVNPEYFYELLADSVAPDVKAIAVHTDGKSSWITNMDPKPVKKFIVIGSDKKNNSIFSQAPMVIQLKFENGGTSQLDFRAKMSNDQNVVYDIRNVYPARILMPDGSTKTQMKDYYPNNPVFYMAIDLPADTGNGNFSLNVFDMSENVTSFQGSI